MVHTGLAAAGGVAIKQRFAKAGWSSAGLDVTSTAVSRTVTLVLVDAGGSPLGALPPYQVELPWWPETEDVVAGARERYGLDVTVLRLLAAHRPAPPGGAVTYLAEVAEPPTGWPRMLTPVQVDLAPHPLRAAYAETGGPAASLAWAGEALRRLGRGPIRISTQRKTWNLSAIWRLQDDVGQVWLKQVPPFFGHEAPVLSWFAATADAVAPALLATDGARMLLEDVPGEDLFGAAAPVRGAMLAQLHAVQARAVGEADDLVALGVPDRRGDLLTARVRTVAERHGAGIAGLPALIAGLCDRLSAVRRCGLPDTLVHGDFHPGNVRGDRTRMVILDWGDCFVGHPGFDALRMVEDLDDDAARDLLRVWDRAWRGTVPGCEPAAALDLLRPVAPLLGAAAYAGFVDGIEPTEHPYHAGDVPACLHRAAELALQERSLLPLI